VTTSERPQRPVRMGSLVAGAAILTLSRTGTKYFSRPSPSWETHQLAYRPIVQQVMERTRGYECRRTLSYSTAIASLSN
jgi:hypothetical protein